MTFVNPNMMEPFYPMATTVANSISVLINKPMNIIVLPAIISIKLRAVVNLFRPVAIPIITNQVIHALKALLEPYKMTVIYLKLALMASFIKNSAHKISIMIATRNIVLLTIKENAMQVIL